MSIRNTTPSPSGASTPNRPHPLAPYYPPADTATYRDLLLFEERLKSNAEMLRKRRKRYQVFLYTFIGAWGFMLYQLFVVPPKSNLRIRALQASLAVVSVTLVLFFASGMYEEKIKYAQSYITHSNKALRPLNMHLNMRRPKSSFLTYIPFLRNSSPSASPVTPASSNPLNQSSKPFLGGKGQPVTSSASSASSRKVSNSANVMATIPPSSNPRGELIFSSRVDKSFREGYERYRAAFEKRREEKQKEESRLNLNSTNWFLWTTSTSTSASKNHGSGGNRSRRTPSPNPLGLGKTPPISRRQSPSPGPGQMQALNPHKVESALRNSTLPQNSSPNLSSEDKEGRQRSESYSFVLDRNNDRSRNDMQMAR
ncbi:hypothetical protein L486_04470 [Kwoniella mangroviensis CBS 10435]|uniref:Transmembrane protein 188 n=1 Tax=Kwoniella mangroviensis CBS 10435 TaxID=1331196 RepID=A0A1B9ISD6_9TREE|nr:hypothetical protein L486_04470 [Kwoniella mangroviensis CBS 10435]OCF78446.1 hypothetical protein I204_00386 [Kwoniella mangroviensis CBS 8886]